MGRAPLVGAAAAAAPRPFVTRQGLVIRDPSAGWLIAAAYVVLGAALTVGSLRVVPSARWSDALFGAFLLGLRRSGRACACGSTSTSSSALPRPCSSSSPPAAGRLPAVDGDVAGPARPVAWAGDDLLQGLGTLEGAAAGLAAHAVLPGAAWTNLGVSAAVAGCAAATWIAGQAVMYRIRQLPRRAVVSFVGTAGDGIVAVAFAPALLALHDQGSPGGAVVLGVALIAIFSAGARYRERLLRLKADVERLSRTDSLTGVANRRAFTSGSSSNFVAPRAPALRSPSSSSTTGSRT